MIGVAVVLIVVVASYLRSLGWCKKDFKPKDECYSLWHNEIWTDEQKEVLRKNRWDSNIELMLPHYKHYGDYERCMLLLFSQLSTLYDKCECELLREVTERN